MWSSGKLWFAVIAAVLFTVLLVFLYRTFPGAVRSSDDTLNVVQGVLVLVLVGGSALLHGTIKPGSMVRNFLLWVAIVVVLMVGYSYRFELAEMADRLRSGLVPSQGRVVNNRLEIPVSRNGHFVVDGWVNNKKVRFLVDTGASDIVLGPRDAERLGFDVTQLKFNKIFNTANGQGAGASVVLDEIVVGPIVLKNVRASVNRAEMDTSLLGMRFLSRLSRYQVSREVMVLEP